MTPLQSVYDSFLLKINDFDILNLTEEELEFEFLHLLKSSIARSICIEDLKINVELKEFNRVLSFLEIDILALGMVVAWIEPKVNNIELFKMRLSSKDFQVYSQANHLKEIRRIKAQAMSDFSYWLGRYSEQRTLERLKKL